MPWRGRSDTRPSGPVTGSVGQPPETLALAAVLRLPATPPHSPQPEYALASLCTKLSSLSFALFWSSRCQLFIVIREEIVLVVLHMPVFLLFCKKSIRSFGIKSGFCCPSRRNRPCCAARNCLGGRRARNCLPRGQAGSLTGRSVSRPRGGPIAGSVGQPPETGSTLSLAALQRFPDLPLSSIQPAIAYLAYLYLPGS